MTRTGITPRHLPGPRPPQEAPQAPAAGRDPAQAELLLRVLSALLREDVVGLRTRSTPVERQDGLWLRLAMPARASFAGGDASDRHQEPGAFGPSGPGPADAAADSDTLWLPIVADGFQSAYAARLPLLRKTGGGDTAELITLDDVLVALSELAEQADRGGFAAFREECRQTLTTVRLHAASQEETAALLTARHGPGPADWTGLTGSLALDTLAARHDHPVYPTARGRFGLDDEQLRAYAPEFHPRFALRWIALPRHTVTVPAGTTALPPYWPTPADLGLPRLQDSHLALPVHPLSLGSPLREALKATGLHGEAVLADRTRLEAVPTLSMRTVALADDPHLHLKLPLATATLGLRNQRTIKPGTLVDGAAGQRLLQTVFVREPRLEQTVLLADETVYAHAGHEFLAVLCRRYPAGLDHCVVTPMAALLSPAPKGALVIDHLADRFYGGDLLALLDAFLTPLFDLQTTLFSYGIALESHQQNISLVLDRHAGGPRLRLLLKDNDGPRINLMRLRTRLGAHTPDPSDFDDARIFSQSDRPVTDVFTTITVHLCAGAYAFGLARHGRAPLQTLLRLVRDRLAEAIERLGVAPGEPGEILRTHVLDAPQLPIKAMVTAGTLLTKERSGAADINKHYTTGPNYLLRAGEPR